MGDFGSATTTTNSFEPFNADIFKDKTQQELNDSKDSDEGFSSSFSPTSESSIMQDQAIATSLHLWGNNSEKEESYLMTPMAVNAQFQTANSRRVVQAPSPLGQVRKPTPALSNYLAANKAVANQLGVSGWTNQNQQPQPQQNQVSGWPSHQPSPIGTSGGMNSNWNNSIRGNQAANFPVSIHVNHAQQLALQQQQRNIMAMNKSTNILPSNNGNHALYQHQQAVLASVQAKNFKNRNFNSTLSMNNVTNGTNTHTVHQNTMANINSGLDATIVDDITQLTSSFSNLTATSDQGVSNTTPNGFFSNQERRSGDGVKYSALESRFFGDVFKSSLDNDLSGYDAFKGYNSSYKKGFPRAREGSSLNSSPRSDLDTGVERFSRKVFVGGLPPDIDEDEIHASFCQFGPLTVDWPHKAESKSYFPPKGYAFLLYKDEISVQRLIDRCIMQDGKLYLCVSSPTIKDKPVQIRPWNLADADFVMDGSQPLDPRKTIFVGGVPRPLRAVELAMIMDRLYGGVCYAGIDVDPELKYPKGAGRVAFSNQQSYIAAISARFIQLQHGEIDKRVEVKPYVLDDQMCDECHGVRCNAKFAPFFCSNITCLQYYCEQCWAIIHSRPGREFHKPLVKEGGDRPRQGTLGLRWPLKTQQIPALPSIPLLQ